MRLTLLLCLLPVALKAQVRDSTLAGIPLPVTDSALRLPVDRASDLLPWIAGGGLDPDGAPNWHGSEARLLDRVTDGIRWATGLRSRGLLGFGATPVITEPALNTIARAEMGSVGRSPAAFMFVTQAGGDRWRLEGSAESGSPFRADGGSGISRFEGALGGPIGASFRLRFGGTVTGRHSAPTGIGYAEAPYYVPTGIDTTMQFAGCCGPVTATVQRFGAASSIPYSPRTDADWVVRLDGRLGAASVWARWLGTRGTERFFAYDAVANPAQASGENVAGHDVATGLRLPLTSGLHLEGALSLQRERSERGPLTSASESDSRDPALGLMPGGVELRWTMDNFPIDDQLIANYHNNTPGSRRSPYDLENTDQYRLIDQYRNNAYALLGFSESGGPVGLLAFYQDARLLTQAALVWDLGITGSLRVGAELVYHDAQRYSHFLISQANSDVWAETPVEEALLAEWTQHGARWSITAGARLDRFKTGAGRTFLLDTQSLSPTYGQYLYFPRPSSYGAGVDSLQRQVPDAAHSAFAPHVALTGKLGDGFTARVGITRAVRMPDLAELFAGINTDLAITNFSSPFSTDMGHEITDLSELAISKEFGSVRLDGTAFRDHLTRRVTTRLVSLYDPARGANADLHLTQLSDRGSYQGVTLSGAWQATPWLSATSAYTYVETARGPSYASPSNAIRSHTFSLRALIEAPAGAPLEGLGAMVSFRRMSGAAWIVDPLPGPYFQDARMEDIPAWTSLDLRIVKRFEMSGSELSVYLDARNLLNAENLIRAFVSGDPKREPSAEGSQWSNDSANYAREASNSGQYDATGNIDLTFGGAGRGGCGAWVSVSGDPAPPNCAYIIAAEERFGDGNGVFSLAEQRAASISYYRTSFGRSAFTAPGRALRLGAQIGF